MNLPALYQLLASRADAAGIICLPSWDDIARAAEVHPTEDTMAFRALINKGAVERIDLGPATCGDYAYRVRRPLAHAADAFVACLRTIGATVRHLDLQPA